MELGWSHWGGSRRGVRFLSQQPGIGEGGEMTGGMRKRGGLVREDLEMV